MLLSPTDRAGGTVPGLLAAGDRGEPVEPGDGIDAGGIFGADPRQSIALDQLLAHERALLDALVEGVVVQSIGGRVLEINDRALELIGCELDDVLGRPLPLPGTRWRDRRGRLLSPSELPARRALIEGGAVGPMQVQVRHLDGVATLEMTSRPLVHQGSLEAYAVVTTLTPLEQAAEIAPGEDTLARFRLGFDHGSTGMALTEVSGALALVNPALSTLLGRSEEELLGCCLEEFVHPDDRAEGGLLVRDLLAGPADSGRVEHRYVRADGSSWWAAADACVVRGADGAPRWVFWQLQDVTERKREQAALDYHIAHDPLTGLASRQALERQLQAVFDRARASHGRIAVCFLDLDRFALVNEGLGHLAGDRLLVDVAERLISGGPQGAVAARFGGDEFVVVIEDVADAEQATEAAEQLVGLFAEAFFVGSEELVVTASCGVALASPNGGPERLLGDAGVALALAKRRGGGRAEVFDPSLGRVVADRFGIERALRFALQREQLHLHFQPVVELVGGRAVGVEGLLRWEHPSQGLLEPSEFIPTAEASGLIHEIGAFVVEQAVAAVTRWRRQLPGCSQLWVAVNLSTRQLSGGDPVATCAAALARTGTGPEALRLEITESIVMEDIDASIVLLRRLRDLGISLAIDDFGTGYSSLSYLSRLPVSSLKIDRSFVTGLAEQSSDTAILRAIVGLARTMGLELCAEGIELAVQRAKLAELGCSLGQGYLFAPPMPAEDFETWVLGRARSAPPSPADPGAGGRLDAGGGRSPHWEL